jgi:hypothetical protein
LYGEDLDDWAACEIELLLEERASRDKQNVVLREYLERLACLGNGDRHGNSVGNDIAIEALNKTQDLSGLILCEAEPVAWAIEDVIDMQLMDGRPRRVWYECRKGAGIPLYQTRKAK